MLRQKMQIREGGKLSLNNRPPLVMVCLFSDAKTREHSSSASPFCGSFVPPNGVLGGIYLSFVFCLCLLYLSLVCVHPLPPGLPSAVAPFPNGLLGGWRLHLGGVEIPAPPPTRRLPSSPRSAAPCTHVKQFSDTDVRRS